MELMLQGRELMMNQQGVVQIQIQMVLLVTSFKCNQMGELLVNLDPANFGERVFVRREPRVTCLILSLNTGHRRGKAW